ncbi:hypothetical protein PHJA_002114800 [Phtheirospermum japonicum]|uniref:Uncharacterized protein n=1 Tax=Phtheirospermum japonicum TaxID=374723 RepID=A0A830CG54_9LAMI|nr:hypothetical protein PHJA_002114800 [Phtheirospermum japonicum]
MQAWAFSSLARILGHGLIKPEHTPKTPPRTQSRPPYSPRQGSHPHRFLASRDFENPQLS